MTYLISDCKKVYMIIPTHAQIINDLELFIKSKGLKPTAFSKSYFNDSSFVKRLREGSDPRLSTVIKVYQILKRKND